MSITPSNYELNFQEPSIKTDFYIYRTSLFIACGLIVFLSLKLFLVVISCKIIISSMKFKIIHKISVIQEKFLVFLNLLRGQDITRSGPDPARGLSIPAVHLCGGLIPSSKTDLSRPQKNLASCCSVATSTCSPSRKLLNILGLYL